MPAPNNKADRETLKALVRVKLEDGKTYRDVANEVGVSLSTIHRWNKQTVEPAEMEAAKNAITALDLQTLSKTSLINRLVLDAIIEKASNGELDAEDIKTLSRVGVDTSKIHGIHWDKVMLRDGTISHPQLSPSPEQMILLLVAKAEADRAKAASIQVEKEAYEAMKEQGIIDL
ncbi:MAG: hypothetical protein IH975_08230 [Nitrospinae bacterium]|nr:hypothetical protein [Nitrospinota bacterium]